MNRFLAIISLIFVFLVLGHSVYCLFQGKFEQAMFMVPFFMVLYVFVIARRKRHGLKEEKNIPDSEE